METNNWIEYLLVGGPWDGHKRKLPGYKDYERLTDPPIKVPFSELIGGDSPRLVDHTTYMTSDYRREVFHFREDKTIVFYTYSEIPPSAALEMLLSHYERKVK